MSRKLIHISSIFLLLAGMFIGSAIKDGVRPSVAQVDPNQKIEGMLLDKLTSDGNADFIIRFTEQADLSKAYSMGWDARGKFVYNILSETAERSQGNAKSILDAQGLTYQTFIAGNDLYVWNRNMAITNGLMVLNELAALPEVSFIRSTRTYYIDPVAETKPFENVSWPGDFLASSALTTVSNSTNATTDWGINDTKAVQFWTEFGVQGDGIVVANIDSGVQWNHPALDQAFKCAGDPTNPVCWYDPSNICGGSACDNHGHGTHTMGTMVADDDPGLTYIAGMAPNAKWIACKGCETSSCSSFALSACADWILAPGGNPANRPNVVNNSWGGGGGDTWYQAKVNAWRATGIFPAFSAGNTGEDGCNTLGSPGDYQESFGTAAHDLSRTIAYFSSCGPSAFGHSPYTKPNISAPGVDIRSTIPGNGWGMKSGTSMASPHTAGAVALLWSCNPSLKGQIDATFQILQDNATTTPEGNCGTPPDGEGNYTYGYGYLDVLAAGVVSCGVVYHGTIDGHVYEMDGTTPIEGATVSASPSLEGNQIQAITDPNGYYTMDVFGGTYDVTAWKVGYFSQTTAGVIVTVGATTTVDFNIEDKSHVSLAGFGGDYENMLGDILSFPHIELEDITAEINIFNADPIDESLIELKFINMEGNIVSTYGDSIPANSTKTYNPEQLGVPQGFQGTVICSGSAGSQLVGIVNLSRTNSYSLLSYSGQPLPGWINRSIAESYIPEVVRNWEGMNSEIWVQNVGAADTTTVDMIFFSMDGGNEVIYPAPPIPPNGAYVFRVKDITELGDNFRGWAVVQSDQPIISMAETWDADSGNASAYEGFSLGETSYLSTRQYKDVDHFYSQTQILNISNLPANLTAYFYNFDGTQATTITQQVASFSAINLDLKNVPNIPSGFNGSLVLESDLGIVAVTSLRGVKLAGTDRLAQFILNPISPTDFLKFPGLIKDTGGGKSSEFSFFNYGSSSTSVIITFYNQDGMEVAQITDLIPTYGIGRYSTGDISDLGDNYEGYASVKTNPIDGPLIPGETLLITILPPLANYLPIIVGN